MVTGQVTWHHAAGSRCYGGDGLPIIAMDVAAEGSNVKQPKLAQEIGRRTAQAGRGCEVAVLVPCYNEEHAIAKVVADFRAALPGATIYVYDNNSKDGTVAAARSAGAVVRRETHQGKGYVVRRMFNDVEADIYVLVDGDATYDAPSAPEMIDKLLDDRLDMVVATRVDREEAAYRPGHRAGNRLLTGFVAHIFGRAFTDILSGYRVFSRRFVKSFPILSGGFEIETELTVHALELELPVGEVATPYYSRPTGSASKLSTWHDGFRILWTVLKLYRAERPLSLFGSFGIALAHHARSGSPSRSSSPTCRKVWCRGCRPRCSPPG